VNGLSPGHVVARGNERDLRPDAANDGHSGYTIYLRLITMAGEMVTPPAEAWYSFDVNRGSLCDQLGRTWHPVNPDYDPGPPPPPKPPKEKKELEKKEIRVEGDAGKMAVPKQAKLSRQQHGEGSNHRPRWIGEAVPGSSSGQTNRRQQSAGDRTDASGGRGRGYAGPGPVRQHRGRGRGRGGGSRIGTFDKCVHGLLRTLRRL